MGTIWALLLRAAGLSQLQGLVASAELRIIHDRQATRGACAVSGAGLAPARFACGPGREGTP